MPSITHPSQITNSDSSPYQVGKQNQNPAESPSQDSTNQNMRGSEVLKSFVRKLEEPFSHENINPDIYRLGHGKLLFYKTADGEYDSYPEALGILLELDGVELSSDFKERVAQTQKYLQVILSKNTIKYAGGIGGCKPGLIHTDDGRKLLVTTDSGWLEPVPGNWEPLMTLLKGMFTDEQYTVFLCWLHVALRDLKRCREHGPWKAKLEPSQSMIIIGEPGAGKTLLKFLLQRLFGGKSANLYPHCAGETRFNEDLIEAPLLVMDDCAESVHPRHRIKLTQACKSIQVGNEQRTEAKYRGAVMMKSFRRILILANEDSLDMLPLPIDSYADKMILLEAKRSEFVNTTGGQSKDDWSKSLEDSLAAFSHYVLNEFRIPDEMCDVRYGVKAWQNKQLLGLLKGQDEIELASMLIKFAITKKYPHRGVSVEQPYEWEGFARLLYTDLLTYAPPRQVDKLLRNPQKLGLLLRELSESESDCFVRNRRTHGNVKWKVSFKLSRNELQQLTEHFETD